MTKKKSSFWTFIFSLLPGAAEMYMGFMKMGVSLMGLFFGLFIVGGFFGQSIFVLADIVVWFYAFFHAHNLRAMDDEEFYALEDDYLFHLDGSGKEFWNKMTVSRYRKLAAKQCGSERDLRCVYLKTGSVPQNALRQIEKKGYEL